MNDIGVLIIRMQLHHYYIFDLKFYRDLGTYIFNENLRKSVFYCLLTVNNLFVSKQQV